MNRFLDKVFDFTTGFILFLATSCVSFGLSEISINVGWLPATIVIGLVSVCFGILAICILLTVVKDLLE